MSVASPVARSVVSPVASPVVGDVAGGGSSEVTYDIYVDSVSGDDGNAGTLAEPLQTLAAAQAALADNQSLGLARGSYWREQFNVPTNGLTIGVYGTGDMPIIDGAEEIEGTWTQPDNITYPDVWSVSWTRAQEATTGSAHVAIWIDGVLMSRYATTLADLQTNGGYNASTLSSTTSTLSIKSATNPNSDGKLYEASYRRYCINGHATTLGVTKTGQVITGPIEMWRAIDHYNAHAGGQGTTKNLLILDGNIHHTVTQGILTEDCVYTGVVPSATASTAVAYDALSPSTFEHTFRRCLSILPGGTSRNKDFTAFYAHGTTTVAALTIEQCISRGASLGGADALAVVCNDCYAEECVQPTLQAASTNLTFDMDRVVARDLTTISDVNGDIFFRRLSGSTTITLNNCGAWIQKGSAVKLIGTSGVRPLVTNCCFAGSTLGGGIDGGGFVGCSYSVIQANGLMFEAASIVNDFNIFYFVGQSFVRSIIASVLRNSLAAWQAATSQDTNSVFCKAADQTAGNQYALWLGISENSNAGPADGDWRINPGARVYSGADVAFIGTFADGTTPLTDAGIQEHWNFNTRAIVAGPPTRPPVFPTTVAEMRSYVNDPTSWDFYP